MKENHILIIFMFAIIIALFFYAMQLNELTKLVKTNAERIETLARYEVNKKETKFRSVHDGIKQN